MNFVQILLETCRKTATNLSLTWYSDGGLEYELNGVTINMIQSENK